MHILQAGVAKSGNYWLYTLLQCIIKEANIKNKSYIKTEPIYPIAKNWNLSTKNQVDENVMDITNTGCFYRISSIYRRKIINVEDYVNQNTLVWTHSPFCSESKTVFPVFDKRVYIIRDVRDVMISMSKFMFTPYMQTHYPTEFDSADKFLENNVIRQAKSWANHVTSYLKYKDHYDVHIIFYERLLKEFDEELKKLLDYLNINLSQQQMNSISQEVSFDQMSKQNPSHVRKGGLYGWKKHLSSSQNISILNCIKPVLCALNYPPNFSDEDYLPLVNEKKIESLTPNFNARVLSVKDRLHLIKRAFSV
ncbi:sulfotransferase domain-containing protein [Catalinimonas niigatensis]|uniref:sulfotransferase domain-containing protein n=1 Tax=Catalinimonas niigatensis TaxID=1397264 RepID=UPI002665EDA8|nr:sulfotransferase domain-containing protein [Catalinimonas niigatensis]WPP52627.1 sulfotransferase domain-containing protein [Catalinimonas niigatensis]